MKNNNTKYRQQVRKQVKEALEFHRRLIKRIATPLTKKLVSSSFIKRSRK